MRLSAHDGRESMTVGMLLQPIFQTDTVAGDTSVADACFRRIRLVGNAQAGHFNIFADTDTPYLGYHGVNEWSTPPIYLQDLIITYRVSEKLAVDTGLLLVPVSYNSTQSAASLFAIGYSPYSFLSSTPTHSRVGRDQGAQLRGALVNKRLEYRVGIFRGARKDNPLLAPRVTARVAWSFAGPTSPNFFYSGTQQGKAKKAIVGISADNQEMYHAVAADGYIEWPTTKRQRVTLQADIIHYDGGRTFKTLAPQMAWMLEGGYLFTNLRLQPFAQVARQNISNPAAPDAASYQAGLIFWRRAHSMNIKGAIGRTTKDRTTSHTQVIVQTQVFVF